MKNLLKRMSSGLLALFIVVSILSVSIAAAPASNKITTTPTGYDSASDVVYVKSTVSGKQIIANWGARGENCVFLSTYAVSYYTGEYSFETLSSLSGGSSQSNAPSSALYKELQELMSSTHTFYTYYDGSKNVRDYYMYTDCVSNNTNQVALLYRGGLVTSSWNGGNIWNQEHMWPKSKLSADKQIGDIMQLRPANPSENSSRGNTAYGVSSGYYNPGPSVRGDCARLVLYMYVRWGTTSTMWGKNGVIENLNVLLDWMEEDPVDTWEMGRNDSVQSVTGVRNVFVDYPELAWLMFGQDVPDGITTPSGNDGTTTNPGGGNTTPPTTNPPATNPPATNPPATNPPATNPPATNPPATNPPATNPPATNPPATEPPATNPPATEPPVSEPGTSEGTQTSTPATQSGQPAPLPMASVNPNDFIREEASNDGSVLIIILAIAAVVLVAGAVVVYFVVIKPKHATSAVSEEVSVEEIPEETPAEEVTEDTPNDSEDNNE